MGWTISPWRALAAGAGLAGAAGAGLVGAARALRHAGPPPPRHPLLERVPMFIAHRGGSGVAPENTIPAFLSAVADWRADMLELDVRASADGECVVIHDPTVDRTTDGSGAVAEMPLSRIRELDAGHRFTPDGGRTYSFRGRGVRVPTFAEVIRAVPEVPIIVEIKTGMAQLPLLRAIEETGCGDRLVIAGARARDRTLFSDWPGPTSATRESLLRLLALHRIGLTRLWRPVAQVANVPEFHRGRRVVTPRLIKALHARGMPVHIWTVNEPADMHRLLDWGADGLLTDHPERLDEVLALRVGRPAPPARGKSQRHRDVTS